MDEILSATVDSRNGIVLDPRTKLFMLITITTLMFSTSNDGIMNIVKPILSLIPFALILSEHKFKTAGKYAVLYAVCFVLERLALNVWSGMISFLVLAATSIMTRFAPGIMTGAYLISSTSVSEFISAMERMHVTEKIIIPLSVIFRFFPTIKEEYQAIRDAMKMRNIRIGGKNPFLMIEYRLIPLMVSVIKIGDELSAALNKGTWCTDQKNQCLRDWLSCTGFYCHCCLLCMLYIVLFASVYCFFEVVHYDKNRSCNIYIWRK